jgi:hypothetical protein
MANPPQNPIIGKARADEWDQKISQIEKDVSQAYLHIKAVADNLGVNTPTIPFHAIVTWVGMAVIAAKQFGLFALLSAA